MYAYWTGHASDRNGQGPKPADLAAACETTIHAAREAIRRYRRGRVPAEHPPGLSVKSIRNVHVVMRRGLDDAVAWDYLHTNPATYAVVPRQRGQRRTRQHGAVWTPEELGAWLRIALADRYGGMWLLAATTGMRRSELAVVSRSMLDLDDGLLIVEDTRVVVGGRSNDSDGKSAAGRREIALDTFTVEQLNSYIATLDVEREASGDAYPDHGYLMVGPEGRRLHPDTITARFNRLVDKAGVPHIRLHDVRHTYATLALDAGGNIKTLRDRIGHADTSVTMQLYTHRSRGRDRGLAQTMGDLIQGTTKPPEQPSRERSGTDLGTHRLDM